MSSVRKSLAKQNTENQQVIDQDRFVVIGSLVAFSASASASADIRYTGSPKFGQFVASQSQSAARAGIIVPGQSNILDAKDQMLAPLNRMYKGGIGARGI